MKIDSKYAGEINSVLGSIGSRMSYIDEIARKADLPRELVAAIWYRENSAMAAFTEAYNGFGYRNKNRASAYVLAGTQYYNGGMYVADGTYNASKWDSRPGTLALMAEMTRRFPS